MIPSHLVALVVFSALVSSVFALLLREAPAERRRFGLMLFAGFVLSAVTLGWLMAGFPAR